ncbi:expressed unknown protein [Seminavis robusta]|uniref:Uncharacterized protein n=1 Tax=Seminavis robusta TaxID=568900 RepID=A0A9N8F3L0_9STRA|nr:expressed unknown protein [Seminavis robusta]|eukprot:Sro3146_g344421.1  (112) ;mRNA; r:3871-4206
MVVCLGSIRVCGLLDGMTTTGIINSNICCSNRMHTPKRHNGHQATVTIYLIWCNGSMSDCLSDDLGSIPGIRDHSLLLFWLEPASLCCAVAALLLAFGCRRGSSQTCIKNR